jgi:putative MATE family efflux protein
MKTQLTEGPILKGLLLFSIPILLGSIVTELYHVADSVVVGQFIGADALAAVSAGAPVMTIINMFLIGLSSGSNVVIAQRVGAGDGKALQKAVGTVAVLTLSFSAFITIVGLCVSRPLLNLLGTPDNIISDAHAYLFVIFLGVTGNLVYNMGSGALRGMGDSTWPFYFLLLCSGLNVVLDLVAVALLGWGVVGVAVATSLSQLVSGIGILARLNRGDYGVSLKIRDIRYDRKEGKAVALIGLPAGIQNIGNSLAAMCVQSSANFFGSTFIAANSIVTKMENFAYIPVVALSTALCTFVGQNIGRFKMERIRKGINDSILVWVGVGCLMGVGMILLRNVLPLLFTQDRHVAEIASRGLMVMAAASAYHGIDRCLVNAMRGAGKSVVPMVTAQFGAFSRIPLAYFLGVRRGDYMGIFYAMAIASALRCAAIAFYYYCGGWKRAVEAMRIRRGDLPEKEDPPAIDKDGSDR